MGVCGSDVHYFEHGRIGKYVVEKPLVLGHEAAGVIVAAGPDCDRGRVGKRVAIEPGVPCGRCPQCRAGAYNLCPDILFFATPPVDGAFCDYLVHDGDFLFDVPDTLPAEVAALCEPLSVGIWASAKADVRPGDRVLVTGCGPIGLLAAEVARARGAEVALCDSLPERLQVARGLGFHEVVEAGALPGGSRLPIAPTVLIECTGAPPAVHAGLRSLEPGGRAVLVGSGPVEDLTLPVSSIQTRELHVTGVFRYANTYPVAIGMLAGGSIAVEPFLGATFPLDQTATALHASKADPRCIKPMVIPSLR